MTSVQMPATIETVDVQIKGNPPHFHVQRRAVVRFPSGKVFMTTALPDLVYPVPFSIRWRLRLDRMLTRFLKFMGRP